MELPPCALLQTNGLNTPRAGAGRGRLPHPRAPAAAGEGTLAPPPAPWWPGKAPARRWPRSRGGWRSPCHPRAGGAAPLLAGVLHATCAPAAVGKAPAPPAPWRPGRAPARRRPAPLRPAPSAPVTGKASSPPRPCTPAAAGEGLPAAATWRHRLARPAVAMAWSRRSGLAARAERERREGRWKERRDKGNGRREIMNR